MTRRLSVGLAVALTGGLVAGGALLAQTGPSEPEPDYTAATQARAANAKVLGPSSASSDTLGLDALEDDATIARKLSSAPWSDPDGLRKRSLADTPDLGALSFPPGVTYAEAVTQIFMAAVSGRAPRGARLTPSLPLGTVAVVPSTGEGPIEIDLRVPFGYEPDGQGGGRISLPSVALERDATPSTQVEYRRFGRAGWPIGARAVPVILPACMRIPNRDATPTGCTVNDVAIQDLDLLRGPKLP